MLVLPWSSWKEKCQSSLCCYCGLQVRQIEIRLTTACGAYCKRKCTKHASQISTTSNIASESEPSGPSWITPSLLQLCVSGVAVFQLVSGRSVVISSTAFNSDIVFLRQAFVHSRIKQLQADIPVWFSCSCQYDVRFNTWRSFNLQGKVVTLFRCSRHLLC